MLYSMKFNMFGLFLSCLWVFKLQKFFFIKSKVKFTYVNVREPDTVTDVFHF